MLRRPAGHEDDRRLPRQRYTVNQDADQWHLLYAWTHNGSLYTLSEHIAPPLHAAEDRPEPEQDARRAPSSSSPPDAPDPAEAPRGRRRRGALAAAGIYELVDQLGGSPSRPAAGGLPPEQHLLDGVRIVEDNGVEVVVPPLHHQLVTAHGRASASASLKDAQSAARGHPPAAGEGLRPDARPGSASPSPGGCRTSAPTSRSSPTSTSRSTCARRRPRTSRSRCCSTRGGSRATRRRRSSRRTTSPCSSAATASSTSPPASKAIFQDVDIFRADEHPPRLRGRRLRRRPEPPEEDGGRREGAGRVPDPRPVGALPRLHLDAEGRPRPAEDREPRGARLQQRRATSARARTSPSRTSPRTSRPGTSTSRTRSASRPCSGRG